MLVLVVKENEEADCRKQIWEVLEGILDAGVSSHLTPFLKPAHCTDKKTEAHSGE